MKKRAWTLAGALCFIMGWVGLIVPGIPGVVFFIGAVYCFARGHPVWEAKMLAHPVYGPPLRDWYERRAISRGGKKSAMIGMAVSGALCGWLIPFPYSLISITCLICVAIWIWTRPE